MRNRLSLLSTLRWTAATLVLLWIWGTSTALAQEDTSPPPDEETLTTLDEIEVTASYSLNRETPVDGVALSRDEIVKLPTFADDLFRAINLVPGTSGNDVSSAFSVRGAPFGEVLVRLDGVELFEPFHLKDFSGVFSVVDPQVVDGIEIIPGALPAPYGDRSAAAVDLTTRRPRSTATRTGISLSSIYFSRGQRFGSEDRGAALFSVRRGWLDVVFNLVGPDEEEEEEGAPEYIDLFAKADWTLDDRTELGIWLLWADDTLDSSEIEDDGTLETIDSSYGNGWLVGRGQRLFDDAVASARLFAGRVDRDRRAEEDGGESDFDVRDERKLNLFGLAADTSFQLGSRHLLDLGFEARSYRSAYDYAVARRFTDPIAEVGSGVSTTSFDDTLDGESFGLWLSDRWRLGRSLVAEVGLRYDRQTWLEEEDDQVSPRFNLVYDLGSAGVLRAGWGHVYQSQRPNELAVEDGDTTFYTAERAEHRTLGWERTFSAFRLRVDAFQRLGTDLRPRYVNLFSPVVLFPEGTPDRLRLDPERSRAQGFELFAQGKGSGRLSWWASYAWSEVEDRIDGTSVPRANDQTHALTLSLGTRLGSKWNLDAVFLYHTGWPITEVSARLEDGNIVPVLGSLYGDRVDDYHRLDVRLSRSFRLDWADLQLYFDIQNLYNRENEQGFEFGEGAFQVQPDGSVQVEPEIETWLGIVPSFGLTWSF
jgi:hypothetical protein